MAGYRIPRQPEGTRISWWPDPRGVDHPPHFWGTIIQHTADTVLVVWDDDDDHYEVWDGRDMRYRIDRGQMRLKQPPKARRIRLPPDQLTCKVCGKPRQLKCGCPRVGAVKPEEWGAPSVRETLTPAASDDRVISSLKGQSAPHEPKGANMATTKAEPLSAKEAATELGTDARTLRKFLRKRSGLVGQGNRWAIEPKELKALKKEFDAWAKGTAEAKAAKAKPPVDDDEVESIEDLEDALQELDDDDLEELDA